MMEKKSHEVKDLFDKMARAYATRNQSASAFLHYFNSQRLEQSLKGLGAGDYTILDIESHFASLKSRLSSYDVDYISSQNYKNIFKQDWDLLIAIHCLSETPQYYYTDIYENLSIKKFFVIDYGIEKDDPAYEPTLQKWFNGFDNGEKIINLNLAGAAKRNGIPVYIGK